VAERGVALAWVGIGCKPAGLAQVGYLIPLLDAPGVDRLPHLGRDHHVEIVVVALGDLVLVVLVQHLAEHGAIAERLAADPRAEILRRPALDLVDDADAEPDRAQRLGAARHIGKPGDGGRRDGARRGADEFAPRKAGLAPGFGSGLVCHL